jgi:hypothetical protein
MVWSPPEQDIRTLESLSLQRASFTERGDPDAACVKMCGVPACGVERCTTAASGLWSSQEPRPEILLCVDSVSKTIAQVFLKSRTVHDLDGGLQECGQSGQYAGGRLGQGREAGLLSWTFGFGARETIIPESPQASCRLTF